MSAVIIQFPLDRIVRERDSNGVLRPKRYAIGATRPAPRDYRKHPATEIEIKEAIAELERAIAEVQLHNEHPVDVPEFEWPIVP